MKKLFLILLCLNLNLNSAIGSGLRIDSCECPIIEDNGCNGYCC